MRYDDRRRAQIFGEDAERYDRARPSYPVALVDDLMAAVATSRHRPTRVLDVGCGTGKAGSLLLARGCDVLGLEPDERMAAVARRHGLAVEITTIEAWEPRAGWFDLVVSGQAWHWVDPAIGPVRAAAALRPGGRLAAFWNRSRHEQATAEAFDAVYARLAPDLRRDSVVLGTIARGGDGDARAIEATGSFGPVETRTYPWEERVTRDAWLDQLGTHSDHRLLPPDQLDALLAGVGEAIDGLGGAITVHYRTSSVTAVRR